MYPHNFFSNLSVSGISNVWYEFTEIHTLLVCLHWNMICCKTLNAGVLPVSFPTGDDATRLFTPAESAPRPGQQEAESGLNLCQIPLAVSPTDGLFYNTGFCQRSVSLA